MQHLHACSNVLFYQITSSGMLLFYEWYRDYIYQYQNPSLYSWYDQYYRNPSVAVFGAPSDVRVGSPKVYYQVLHSHLPCYTEYHTFEFFRHNDVIQHSFPSPRKF